MQTATVTRNTYHGWANYETWNVSLWIQNEFRFYSIARDLRRSRYSDFVAILQEKGITHTPDGVEWEDFNVDVVEINNMLDDLRAD